MAARVDILTSGYAELTKTGFQSDIGVNIKLDRLHRMNSFTDRTYMKATGSCCLVRANNLNVLFDTMGPWEGEILIKKLQKLKIVPSDIDYLVCSHSHPDHIGNLNLFTKAKRHFVGTSVYSSVDEYDLNFFEPTGNYAYKTGQGTEVNVITHENAKIGSHIRLEHTPGHTLECISVIVDNCDQYGTIGLVGDLFEREEDVPNESIWIGAGSQNMDLQRAQRSRIYNQVSYILPGHGPVFKTNTANKLQ